MKNVENREMQDEIQLFKNNKKQRFFYILIKNSINKPH